MNNWINQSEFEEIKENFDKDFKSTRIKYLAIFNSVLTLIYLSFLAFLYFEFNFNIVYLIIACFSYTGILIANYYLANFIAKKLCYKKHIYPILIDKLKDGQGNKLNILVGKQAINYNKTLKTFTKYASQTYKLCVEGKLYEGNYFNAYLGLNYYIQSNNSRVDYFKGNAVTVENINLPYEFQITSKPKGKCKDKDLDSEITLGNGFRVFYKSQDNVPQEYFEKFGNLLNKFFIEGINLSYITYKNNIIWIGKYTKHIDKNVIDFSIDTLNNEIEKILNIIAITDDIMNLI